MSRIAIVGDIHGKIDFMLEKVLESGADVIIQVGDFGTFISEEKMDKATRRHEGLGDFVDYYSGRKKFPIPVHFVKGNHEDFDILEEIKSGKIKNLQYMENGQVYEIAGMRFGALGGNYSKVRFSRERRQIRGGRRKHFNYQDIDDLLKCRDMDAIIAHDCPTGIGFKSKFGGEGCGSEELRELIKQIRPDFYFHGHYHRYNEVKINKTKIICLGIIQGQTQSVYLLD